MTTDEFIKQFKYEPDGIDSYHILKEGGAGDCDDFAVTVAYLLSGGILKFWLDVWTFRITFHRVKTSNGTHLVLKYKGMYIDNIKPIFRSDIGFKRKFPYIILPPVVMLKMLIGKVTK